MDRSKKLRKAIYKIDESMKNKFPIKNTKDILEDEINYCQKLIKVVEKEDNLKSKGTIEPSKRNSC